MTVQKTPPWPVLIVDDESSAIPPILGGLRLAGITNVLTCQDSREVMGLLAKHEIGLVMLDLIMPHLHGHELLPQITERYPDVPVLIVTGLKDVEMAVKCIQLGALDYMVKPFELQRMLANVKRAVELRELRLAYASLKDRMLSEDIDHPEAFASILTNSPKMHALFRFAEAIAGTDKPVLINGETGAGKELMARAMHALNPRGKGLVAVNVAGVDDNVFSDTLFGHTRGAFTGADTVRSGLLEQARGGTLFLDEIGDLTHASQVKLLRLLQEREYYPVGADVPKFADVRIIVATNRDLDALVHEGQFRKDLYYRLQIHRIQIPPLRERIEDLPLLLSHFLAEAANTFGKKRPTPPRELVTLLSTYAFPGNIRELEAMVYASVGQHQSGKLSMDKFKSLIDKNRIVKTRSPATQEIAPVQLPPAYFPTLKETTAYLIEEALKRSGGNQSIAAEMLGITASALNKRLKRSSQNFVD